MGVLVALLLVWWRFQRQLDALIPSWLVQAGLSLLHGKMPQLSPAHLVALALGGMVVLLALFCLAFIVLQIRSRIATTPIYDMRLVEEKTARPAYRVRLHLFMFSSQVARVSTHAASLSGRLWQQLIRQPFPWSSLMDVYRDRRPTTSP